MSKQQPQSGLVPKLRFPEFREAGEWESELVKNLVATIAPPKKLTSDLYQSEGRFPVIDQSQEYICGWTNDEDALVSTDLPLIVFGDHTCALKFVNEPFVQGADGIKILKAHKKTDPAFLYQFLLFSPVRMESYKRHFSTLKEKLIAYPDKKTGEQQKIADCLSFLDALIAAQADKLDALKTHKKGLMQQLFPRDGETVPRLRFPEFREAGEWEENSIEDLIGKGFLLPPKDGNHGNIHPKASDYVESGIPFIMASDIQDGMIDLTGCTKIRKEQADNLQKGFAKEGDVLLTHKGTVGEVAMIDVIDFPYLMLTPQVTYYRVKNKGKLCNRFLASFFCSARFQNELMMTSGGGTRSYIGITEQRKLKIALPSNLREQQEIAACLSSLDALIAAQADKLDALKAHKKGLMQQLFPSSEA